MGMYDTVHFEGNLPTNEQMAYYGLNVSKMNFQTKCLGKSLRKYVIKDNHMFVEKYKTEEWVDDFNPIGGHLDQREPYLDPIKDYTGILNFYTFEYEGNMGYWIEYNAEVDHGEIKSVVLKDFHTRDQTESNEKLKKIFAEAMAAKEIWYNKYIFFTKPWEKFRRFTNPKLSKGLLAIERSCSKIRMRYLWP